MLFKLSDNLCIEHLSRDGDTLKFSRPLTDWAVDWYYDEDSIPADDVKIEKAVIGNNEKYNLASRLDDPRFQNIMELLEIPKLHAQFLCDARPEQEECVEGELFMEWLETKAQYMYVPGQEELEKTNHKNFPKPDGHSPLEKKVSAVQGLLEKLNGKTLGPNDITPDKILYPTKQAPPAVTEHLLALWEDTGDRDTFHSLFRLLCPYGFETFIDLCLEMTSKFLAIRLSTATGMTSRSCLISMPAGRRERDLEQAASTSADDIETFLDSMVRSGNIYSWKETETPRYLKLGTGKISPKSARIRPCIPAGHNSLFICQLPKQIQDQIRRDLEDYEKETMEVLDRDPATGDYTCMDGRFYDIEHIYS